MEQRDELLVAGVLVHEVGQREVHGIVSRVSVGPTKPSTQIPERPQTVNSPNSPR